MVNRCAKCDNILGVLESGIEYVLGNQTLFLCRACNAEFETRRKADLTTKNTDMGKYEYKVVRLQGDDLGKEQIESELNLNGENSWNLVSVLPIRNQMQSSALFIFKRKKRLIGR